jgi:hypothetical protein
MPKAQRRNAGTIRSKSLRENLMVKLILKPLTEVQVVTIANIILIKIKKSICICAVGLNYQANITA